MGEPAEFIFIGFSLVFIGFSKFCGGEGGGWKKKILIIDLTLLFDRNELNLILTNRHRPSHLVSDGLVALTFFHIKALCCHFSSVCFKHHIQMSNLEF